MIKHFEQALKGKMGWKCSSPWRLLIKKSSLRDVTCKKCGKIFKLIEILIYASAVRGDNRYK
jgi:hypothetical protein